MKGRQRLQFALLVFIVFGGLVARSGYWVFWAFAASLSTFVLLFGETYLDLLFLDENEFLYEPNYKHWEKLNDPKY